MPRTTTLPPREGSLYFMDNALQPGTGTAQARGVTPNPDRALWPSQFVHVRLILDTLKNAKLVPSGAVQIGQNGPYVFVVKKDSTLDLRQVKPGQQQGRSHRHQGRRGAGRNSRGPRPAAACARDESDREGRAGRRSAADKRRRRGQRRQRGAITAEQKIATGGTAGSIAAG